MTDTDKQSKQNEGEGKALPLYSALCRCRNVLISTAALVVPHHEWDGNVIIEDRYREDVVGLLVCHACHAAGRMQTPFLLHVFSIPHSDAGSPSGVDQSFCLAPEFFQKAGALMAACPDPENSWCLCVGHQAALRATDAVAKGEWNDSRLRHFVKFCDFRRDHRTH